MISKLDQKIHITIKLAGAFRIDRFKQVSRTYPAKSKVADVIYDLRLPETLLGIILINGCHTDKMAQLNDGDTLSLLPLLDGG